MLIAKDNFLRLSIGLKEFIKNFKEHIEINENKIKTISNIYQIARDMKYNGLEYKVNNSQSNYILIEMKIEDTMTSVDLLVNVIDEKDDNGDSNALESSYIIIIAVTSVVVIGVIALVIFFLLKRKRNKDGLNEIQNSSIQMTQPLQSLG